MSESKTSGESRLMANLGTAALSGVVTGVGLSWSNVVTGTEGYLFAGGSVLTGLIAIGLTWIERKAKNN